MFIQQFYTSCLSEAAYYIESDREAAIIDPLRDVQQYIDFACRRGAKIRFVFETHFHADFVSGHLDLAREAGAVIVFGPCADPEYDAIIAHDNELFQLGNIKIKVLHTPGHTLESSCFLVIDNHDKPRAVFTGDTLFVGEVGRPDLAVSNNITKEELAGMLYESLNTKIKTLPDTVIVYPGHGAGSACGKNIGKEAYSTIGMQKHLNYALQEMTKDEFVRAVTAGLAEPPKYFFSDAAINKKGYKRFSEIIHKNLTALSLSEFENEMANGTFILDTRDAAGFANGFVPGAVNIGLGGQFATWAGTLIDIKTPIILVTEIGKEEETITRLARVGFESIKGYLRHGIEEWKQAGKPIDTISTTEAKQFALVHKPEMAVLDVRNADELVTGIVPGAKCIPLSRLGVNMLNFDQDEQLYVYCAGGYRSMIACSLLKKLGFNNVININGGMAKIAASGIKLERRDLIKY